MLNCFVYMTVYPMAAMVHSCLHVFTYISVRIAICIYVTRRNDIIETEM